MTNPNPNVEAGEALRQYSETIAEYKQRGETLIRDPLAELQRARARITELEAQLAVHEYNDAEGERFEPELIKQIKGLEAELARYESVTRTQIITLDAWIAKANALESERDDFIAKLAQARAECDKWCAMSNESTQEIDALSAEILMCQHERDELRARLNAVRRAAGDV